MEEKPIVRCQSCGMPLGPGFYGKEPDGTENPEYCKFCYMMGIWTMPDMTVDDMIQMSIENMTGELHMSLETATQLAQTTIPTLKRWNHI